MIRVRRPKQVPPKLKAQASTGLTRAFLALNTHGAGSKDLKNALVNYDGGREALFLAQYKKCAFCERRVQLASNPLEHFRPKAEAWRHLRSEKPRPAEPGYWWLTWAWKNHLFSCHACNSGKKQNYFPLASGSPRLAGPAAPYQRSSLQPTHTQTSVEDALLVDPASEDPLDHIEWRPVNPAQPKKLWKWLPSPLTPKGHATIDVLNLASNADLIEPHLRDNVLARAEEVCKLVDQKKYAEASKKWRALGKAVVRRDSDLAGPTWNAVHYLVDQARRQKAGLPAIARP